MLSAALPVPQAVAWDNSAAIVKQRTFEFHLKEQTLAAALGQFEALTGIQYFYGDSRLAQHRTRPVVGQLSAADALSQMLMGSGFQFTFTNVRTVVIHRRPAPTAKAVQTVLEVDPDFGSVGTDHVYELTVSAPRTTALGFRKISPTTVLEGQRLKDLGITNLASALYDTPAVTASRSAENTVYTAGPSVNMLDLRDLGVVRTLVVVNGRRHVPTSGGSPDFVAVDMNVLPTGLVDRVEVLTTGASVLYGADAVGGLVNVTLKDDYEGLDVSMLGNMSEHGDNGRYNLSASMGHRFAEDRAYYMGFVNINRHDGLKARKRHISSDPAGFAANGYPALPENGVLTRGFGRAPASVNGTATGYALGNGDFRNFEGEEWIHIGEDGFPAGDYEGFPEQRYNWAEHSDLTAPIDTFVYSGNLLYDVADSHRFFLEHTLARSVVDREIAPTPSYVAGQQGIFVPISNPFIPEEIRAQIREAVGDDVSGVFINRRLAETGNRTHDVRRDLLRVATGFEGDLGGSWSYGLSYQFGSVTNIIQGTNVVDMQKVAISVSPELCAQYADQGCTLTSYFGRNSISPSQADFIRTRYRSKDENIQHIAMADFRGEILDLPAGPLSAIFGLQYRREVSDVQPDELVQQGRIGGLGFSVPLHGSFNVFESHLAASIPVLDQSPLAYGLTFDAGLRYSHFSTVGSIASWQLGVDYRPIKAVSIRASYQEANRAPNLSELFTPATSQRHYYYDPCNELEADSQSDTVQANCRANVGLGGVSDGFYQVSVYADGQFSGNPTLQEEKALTKNVGITIKPDLGPRAGDLYLSIDWFDIKVKNFIRGRSLQYLIDACYQSDEFSSLFCGENPANGRPFFIRDPQSHEIGDINLALLNGGTFNARGIDTEIIYKQSLENFGFPADSGDIRLRLLHSYNLRSRLHSMLGGETEVFRGSISRPIHKLLASLTYENGPLFLDWSVRYRSKGIVNPAEDADIDGNLAPGIRYHNLAVKYALNDRFSLQGGVENLFDQAPPFLAYAPHNTFPEYYDVVGRRFYLGFQAGF